MRTRRRIGAAVLALLACASAAAAGEEDLMSAEEVRQLLTGNTLTGRYNNGNSYSEYHHPDGRVFGHNNRKPVERGCWEMRANLACYYYQEDKQRGPFCWSFRRVGGLGIRATFVDRDGWEIVAILQKGNPHGHSDNGKPWMCEPLQSQITPPDGRTRLASR
jgi:hypothetical protein